jgi:F0F1-type ATP synthase assembly protein I
LALFFVKDIIEKSNNPKIPNQGEPWWKPAVQIFSQISTWIVVPIVLALIMGKKLDAHFNTQPWIFIGLALFGFLISCYGIFKEITKYIEKIKKLGEENK